MRPPGLRGFRTRPDASHGPVRLLVVCAGNVCRSVYAAQRLAAGFDALAPGCFQLRSAGTAAMVEDPADPHLAPLLEVHGLPMTPHRARQLTERMLTRVDIVLTATVAQRTEVVRLRPALLRRTFTLREFALLLQQLSDEAELARADAAGSEFEDARSGAADPHPGGSVDDTRRRWQQLPGLLGSRRSGLAGEPLDIVDPYGRGPQGFARMVGQMAPALEVIIRWEETQRGRG